MSGLGCYQHQMATIFLVNVRVSRQREWEHHSGQQQLVKLKF